MTFVLRALQVCFVYLICMYVYLTITYNAKSCYISVNYIGIDNSNIYVVCRTYENFLLSFRLLEQSFIFVA